MIHIDNALAEKILVENPLTGRKNEVSRVQVVLFKYEIDLRAYHTHKKNEIAPSNRKSIEENEF